MPHFTVLIGTTAHTEGPHGNSTTKCTPRDFHSRFNSHLRHSWQIDRLSPIQLNGSSEYIQAHSLGCTWNSNRRERRELHMCGPLYILCSCGTGVRGPHSQDRCGYHLWDPLKVINVWDGYIPSIPHRNQQWNLQILLQIFRPVPVITLCAYIPLLAYSAFLWMAP